MYEEIFSSKSNLIPFSPLEFKCNLDILTVWLSLSVCIDMCVYQSVCAAHNVHCGHALQNGSDVTLKQFLGNCCQWGQDISGHHCNCTEYSLLPYWLLTWHKKRYNVLRVCWQQDSYITDIHTLRKYKYDHGSTFRIQDFNILKSKMLRWWPIKSCSMLVLLRKTRMLSCCKNKWWRLLPPAVPPHVANTWD